MTTLFLQETDWGYKVISLLWYVKGCPPPPPPCTHLPPHSLAGNLVRVVFCQYCKEFLRKFCVLAREFHVTKKLTWRNLFGGCEFSREVNLQVCNAGFFFLHQRYCFLSMWVQGGYLEVNSQNVYS